LQQTKHTSDFSQAHLCCSQLGHDRGSVTIDKAHVVSNSAVKALLCSGSFSVPFILLDIVTVQEAFDIWIKDDLMYWLHIEFPFKVIYND
jgi:hypothetical protein